MDTTPLVTILGSRHTILGSRKAVDELKNPGPSEGQTAVNAPEK
jgi:hypothetical protein